MVIQGERSSPIVAMVGQRFMFAMWFAWEQPGGRGNYHFMDPLASLLSVDVSNREGLSARGPMRSANPSEPKLLCIIGIARTGTNHLASVLADIPEIDSRRELFNPLRSWTMHPHELAELSRRSGKTFPHSPEDARAVQVIRQHPDLALDCLADLLPPDKRILCLKVFRNQLSIRQVKRTIIRRPDTIVVFVRRRPIDTYVSYRKAAYLKQWAKVDTTKLKVTLDPAGFVKWWRQTAAWYLGVEAACWSIDKPFHRLSYEEDIDCPPIEAARRFCAVLERHGIRNLTMPQADKEIGLTRQDLNREVGDRVANWPEFRDRLAAMGFLEKAIEPFPQFEPGRWDRLRRRLFERSGSFRTLGAAAEGARRA
jgi:Sulfotransferase family